MKKYACAGAIPIFLVAVFTLAGQTEKPNAGPWSGVIVNASCDADEAFAETAKCTAETPGAALALYDDTIRQVYALDPQDQAKGRLSESVTVEGGLDGHSIHVASIRPFPEVGLRTGQKAPEFSAPDQFGKTQTLETLRGSKGTVLLFYRSADWCPYCKGQLIQLQAAKERFLEQGIKLAGISYDNVGILKFFSERRNIDFPLLSDPDSKIIRTYRVLNAEAVGPNAGMARPGYFFIDPNGVIREKFFEAKYRERLTGNTLLSKLFPELGEEVTDTVEAPHLQLREEQSDRLAVPGNLVSVTADVRLPPDVHVYAPGTTGYKPIKLTIDPVAEFEIRHADYPASKTLYLPVIQERVSVFEGSFRIQQELKVNSRMDFSGALGPEGKTVTVKGTLDYQACDSKVCYLPATVPVEWQFQILPLDRQRAPEEIRHN